MEKKNGFSLVELIAVIAIMGILSTVAVLSINAGKYANVERCSENIELRLGELRQQVMSSKQDMYLIIYQTSDDDYYAAISNSYSNVLGDVDGIKIGGPTINIIGTDNLGSSHNVEYDSVNPCNNRIGISFNKSTGSFSLVDGISYKNITISRGSTTYVITLVKETGKYYRKQV